MVGVVCVGELGRYTDKNKQKNKELSRSSFLEALVSGARPMEIVASTGLISVLNVLVLFHNLLWKAKLDWEWFERKSRSSHYLKLH